MEKKQIAIIGAGISGLLACKYCLSKGFDPIVFEFESDVGGVWIKTIKTTRLQLPKVMYQFSDFPWPPSITDVFPNQQQVLDYIRSYATHFNLMPHIKFHSRVKGITYDGPSSDTWSLWNGTGEAFPPQGKWNVTVENTQTATTQVYTVDFVILSLGRFKDVPKLPDFAVGKGPEVFRGQRIHSSEYSAMDHDKAAEFVKGKKVVVVGFGKTGLDIARECASANGPEHPCTILYRRDHWKLGDWFPWGIPLYSLPIAKYDMVPQYSVLQDVSTGLITYMPNPENFFKAVEKGSIKLKKSQSCRFYDQGILIEEDNTQIETDLVIFATGFDGVGKLKSIFESPTFGHFIAGTPRVSLYRETIHPHIPQLAIIGYTESSSSLYMSEMRCRWLAALLDGVFKLPNVKEMKKDITRWDEYIKQASGEFHHLSTICSLEIWYNDQLCKDMGMNPMRKKGLLANVFEPYGPLDYAEK
ncbi:hypothetical protein L1987_16830 [Smallanthus sonchifolius]|uniref:Uncharacterized protein n=1 Tax=Smallanthus sonchifolius TaxID=185202 RepID=A0ACB9IV61_9ASTR|nr:hypothetical protein L1987_16830 [Smallanthus sonchifolius]